MEDEVDKRVENAGKTVIGKMDCAILGGREEDEARKDL